MPECYRARNVSPRPAALKHRLALVIDSTVPLASTGWEGVPIGSKFNGEGGQNRKGEKQNSNFCFQ
jgi:hypothetical protein